MQFSNEEYADIIFVYGFCDGNALKACREYNKRFPNKRQPSRRVFSDAYQRLREFGIGNSRTGAGGATRNNYYDAVREEEVIDCVLDNPEISTRRIAARLNVSQSFAWRTLKTEVLHPFHKQKVHNLHPGDNMQRLAFCQWLLQQHEQNENFFRETLWSDEATFTRDGINTCRNEHVWSLENPHAFKRRNFQQRFSINVWGGVFNGQLLPIQVLPNRLDAYAYLQFLENDLTNLLEDFPVDLVYNRMWYQHDGAPPHVGRNVVAWLNQTFNGRWIGRRGQVLWPARSPDLNPLDYFVWGHLKQLVYAVEINNQEQLMEQIINAVESTQNRQNMQLVYDSLILRCQACIRANGGIFEHLI